MNVNPLTLLDVLLAEYASPKARRIIHGVILLALSLVTLWLAVEGDWKEFAISLAAAVYAAANRANTGTAADEEDSEDIEYPDEDAEPPAR